MTNKGIKNVHGLEQEYQEQLEKKAEGLVAFMNEEPKAKLIPRGVITSDGRVVLDINMVLIKDDNREESEVSDEDTGVEAGSESDGLESTEPSGDAEPSEAPAA